MKQLSDYHTFTLLDTGEAFPIGCQKIFYQIDFAVKDDL
jgi:hypothetical protein